MSHAPHKTAAPMHSYQPPNDNDIVFYPSGGHFNKFRREGYLRELLDHHFEGWAATRNKKDYIWNVILPKVGTSYFVDKSGEVSELERESAAEKMRYQLDYTKKDRATKKRKSDASTAFPLTDNQSICQRTSLQPSKAVPVPQTTTATKKTVTEAVATAKKASNLLQQHLVMDPIPFEIATATGAVTAPAEIVDAFHTMKESLDRLLICNEKIYFRLFQELNKISDKLDDSSTKRGEEENS